MMIKWPYLSSIGTSTYCILGCLFLGFSPTLPYNWQMFKLERPKDWVRRALTFSLWQLPHLALDQSFGDIPCSLVVIWHSNLRLRIMVQLVVDITLMHVTRGSLALARINNKTLWWHLASLMPPSNLDQLGVVLLGPRDIHFCFDYDFWLKYFFLFLPRNTRRLILINWGLEYEYRVPVLPSLGYRVLRYYPHIRAILLKYLSGTQKVALVESLHVPSWECQSTHPGCALCVCNT